MTELDFLLELILEHELNDKTQKSVRNRIKYVQKVVSPVYPHQIRQASAQQSRVLHGAVQSPSMIAKIENLAHEMPIPTPVVISPVAAQALAARNEAMKIAVSGKEEKGRTSPRKF